MDGTGWDPELILPGEPLDQTIEFLCRRCGLHLASISPADGPREALLEGRGLRIRLDREHRGSPGLLRVPVQSPADAGREQAPNGTVIEFRWQESSPAVPPGRLERSSLVQRDAAQWGVGRAGMLYRDLLPGRMGGRFVISHIRIPDGGPVPDSVHFHAIRFQVIFCLAGWVRVAYQDQGPDFVLESGDLVLQPPRMRHRVMECSDGLEVLEIGCPAEHQTLFDPELPLPDASLRPGRRYGGQGFVHARSRELPWLEDGPQGVQSRDLGVAAATQGLASVEMRRASVGAPPLSLQHHGEFRMLHFLEGEGLLRECGEQERPVGQGDCLVLAPDREQSLSAGDAGLRWLEVRLPATATAEA